VRLAAGGALVAAGRVEDAVEQFRLLTELPSVPNTVWALYAEALAQLTLGQPAPTRNWREVEHLLERASQFPSEAVKVAMLRAKLLQIQGELQQARLLLEQTSAAHPQDVAVWAASAELAARHQALKRAANLWQEAERKGCDRVTFALALTDFWARWGGAQAGPALLRLEKTHADLPLT
jgi:hypothetical protein